MNNFISSHMKKYEHFSSKFPMVEKRRRVLLRSGDNATVQVNKNSTINALAVIQLKIKK